MVDNHRSFVTNIMVQLGVPITSTATRYTVQQADQSLPYRSVWWLTQERTTEGSFRFVPDLSVHLIYDLSGLLEVEPFIIYPGSTFLDLVLPAGVQLLGLQFPVWESLALREETNDDAPLYSVSFDAEWAYLIYFTLLDLRNNGEAGSNELHQINQFIPWIDESLRRDLSNHFVQLATHPQQEAELSYSERHQRRLYQEFTGLPPSQFKRILRFQRALEYMQTQGSLNWDDYFDQAHYIREFKQFTGLTPAQILRQYKA
jgi:AraC-like DNA-binding protein